MRSSSLAALLLSFALTSSASAQADYCRVYRAMTIGTSACYYCLKCPNCNEPAGYVGGWYETTGSCGVCGAANCFAAAAPVLVPGGEPAPAPPGVAPLPPASAHSAAPQRAVMRATLMDEMPLTEEPDVLYDPEIITVKPAKWIVSIDVTEDEVNNPVKLFLVTAKIKPKKKNSSDHYDEASLGFGVLIDDNLNLPYTPVTAVKVKHIGGNHYQFKIEEDEVELNKKCYVHLPMQAAAP